MIDGTITINGREIVIPMLTARRAYPQIMAAYIEDGWLEDDCLEDEVPGYRIISNILYLEENGERVGEVEMQLRERL